MRRWMRNLTPGLRQAWMIGGTVVVIGSIAKHYYFEFSRGLIVEGITKNHLSAKEKLAESREYARWAENDRRERVPALTDEQRRQLQEYLDLIAAKQSGEHPRSR